MRPVQRCSEDANAAKSSSRNKKVKLGSTFAATQHYPARSCGDQPSMCKCTFLVACFVMWTLYFYSLLHNHCNKRQCNHCDTFLTTVKFAMINCCAAFWHLINLRAHGSVTRTGLPGTYFIVSPVPEQRIPTGLFAVWNEVKDRMEHRLEEHISSHLPELLRFSVKITRSVFINSVSLLWDTSWVSDVGFLAINYAWKDRDIHLTWSSQSADATQKLRLNFREHFCIEQGLWIVSHASVVALEKASMERRPDCWKKITLSIHMCYFRVVLRKSIKPFPLNLVRLNLNNTHCNRCGAAIMSILSLFHLHFPFLLLFSLFSSQRYQFVSM